MRKVRTPETSCPYCGHTLSGCANPHDLASPSSGDLSVCINCAGLLELNRSLQPQKLELHVLLRVQMESPECYNKLIQLQEDIKSFNLNRARS